MRPGWRLNGTFKEPYLGYTFHFWLDLLFGGVFFSFPLATIEFLKHQWQTSGFGVSHSESKSQGFISNPTILHWHSIIKQREIHHRRRTETNFSTISCPMRLSAILYVVLSPLVLSSPVHTTETVTFKKVVDLLHKSDNLNQICRFLT